MKLGVTRTWSWAVGAAALGCLLALSGPAGAAPDPSPQAAPGLLARLDTQIRDSHARWNARSALQFVRAAMTARNRARSISTLVVEHYDLQFDPDLSQGDFDATMVVHLRNDFTAPVGKQSWYLPDFDVAAVRVGGEPVAFVASKFDYAGMKLVQLDVTFPSPIGPGQKVDVTLEYGGVIDCSAGSFLGIVPCVVSPGYTVFGGYTFGPYFENPSGYDFTMTYPSNLTATVSATLVGKEDLPSGSSRAHWRNDRFGDMIVVAVGDFETKHETYGGLEVAGYTRASDGPYRASFLPYVADIVDFYSARYHPYEFGKLEYIGVSDGMGFGGMAGSSLLLMAGYNFANDPAAHPSYSSTFSHEIGHQWFAYMLSPSDARGPWLSEGETEYLSSVYQGKKYTEFYGRDLDTIYFRYYNNLYLYAVPPEKDEALTGDFYLDPDMDQDLYVYLAYVKGPMIANVIAQAVGGTDAYAAAIAKLTDAHLYEEYDTEQFRAWLEAASGEDLQGVFDSWVYGSGYPTYQVRVVDGTDDTGGTVRARVARSAAFAGPLEIGFRTATGTTFAPVVFAGDDLVTEVEASLDGPLVSSKLDPTFQQLRRLTSDPSADLNGNGQIDGDDVIFLAWSQGSSFAESQTSNDTHWLVETDVVIDGVVDDQDLAASLDAFGQRNGD